MLGEHVERALGEWRRVLRAEIVGIERGPAFEHLEAVGGHEYGPARLVHAVVGAAYALGKAAGALRRADMDDEVDVAPVDAEVEGRGRHHGPQRVRLHRLLDAPPLADIERAVMQCDRQRLLVHAPQRLEHELGLHAGVDEDQRQPVRLDRGIDVADGMGGDVPRQRQPPACVHDADLRLRAAPDGDEAGRCAGTAEIGLEIGRLAHRRGKADGAHPRRKSTQAREVERKQVAAL